MSRSTTTSPARCGRLKPEVALYVGGMGHRNKNFHNDIMVRRGFGDAAKRIQELYLAGRKDEAIAAVPDEWVDMKSLVGPPARIRQRYRAWEEAAPTLLNVRSRPARGLEAMAEAARLNYEPHMKKATPAGRLFRSGHEISIRAAAAGPSRWSAASRASECPRPYGQPRILASAAPATESAFELRTLRR